MFSGFIDLPWWGYVVVTLAMTHVTIASVTIFLHRHQAHRALELHPLPALCFRFWLWLTTGMVTKEWAAIHRKHHAKCETPEDPHSPQVHGINRVLWTGVFLYVKEARNRDTMERYGHGTPDDALERRLFSRFPKFGVVLMLAADVLLFGAWPGVLTGAIISMAHALGETAPLLLIGMVSFIPGIPTALGEPTGALPSLIYIWENASERAFHERTAAAILVLLAFMIVMNAAAIFLRRRFERRW